MNVRNSIRTKEGIMTISRLGQRRQVVIPKAICEELGLSIGDFVEVRMTRGLATVKPKKLVDPDDILTPEEEKRVRKGEAQLKRGKYVLWEDAKRKLKI
jgi:AbrB family looped-hinge helix DNA binding protein